MKKIILILGLIFSTHLVTKAQQESQFETANYLASSKANVLTENKTFSKKQYLATSTGLDKDYNFYLRRSKNYRIVGLSTLGAGLVASGIGLLLATNNDAIYNQSKDDAAAVLFLVGAVSGITSIPFMIMASVYKQKARLMLSNQKTGIGVPSNVGKDITGITFIIPLGK